MSLVVRTGQLQGMADAEPGRRVVQACANEPHWIEFRLVDRAGDPIPGERFTVRLPDQSLQLGRLDAEGRVRFEGILSGQASISFPGIDGNEWWALGDAPAPADGSDAGSG